VAHYACGCVNRVDPRWGVLRCVSKCAGHAAALARQPRGEAYYRALGCFDPGLPPDRHCRELIEALGPLPPAADPDEVALEVGCGASPYVPLIRAAGYQYVGCDADPWAARWTAETYNVHTVALPFPVPRIGRDDSGEIAFVWSAHTLEHLADAPAAVAEMHRLLKPGGRLWALVPDDADPTNPDHQWFFTQFSLQQLAADCGFRRVRVVVRQVVPKEKFLYLDATK
jgi:SAM-dependent methyltransferase